MAKESERSKQMRENFMELHEQGFSIPEIATKFNLEPSTLYHGLQKIADENNVERASLLQRVRTPSERAYKEEVKKIKVNVEDLKKHFSETKKSILTTITAIEKILEEENDNDLYDD